ncbi:MAG: carbohydrate ABC transporter permease [Oricola sp.]
MQTQTGRTADVARRISAHRKVATVSTQTLVVALVILLIVLNGLPFVWGVLTSLKSEQDLFHFPPVFFDFEPTLESYRRVAATGFLGNMLTSFIYCVVAVAAVLVIGLPAAYAFDRYDFPLRRPLFLLIIASIPLSIGAAALLIPTYIYFVRLGLTNTPYVLPLIYAAHQLPMTIWILKGAVESIPRELDEAAIVDGISKVGLLWRVVLPLSRPALAAASILAFVGTWNEFVAGSVMVDSPGLKPIQPLVYSFIGFFGREWGPLTASATLAMLPILFIFVLFGRQFVAGLTKGAVKG